jgi:OmpA-OmpF porin, OOP family
MMSYKLMSATALGAVLAAGCASTPKQIPELDAARAEVQKASSDPLAQEAAGMRLKKAEEALRLADASFTQHKPLPEIQHQAYLAARHAQIAEEQTTELRERKEVESGEAERNRVLLEARTTEAALAKVDADRSKDQASAATAESTRLRAELETLQAKKTDRGMVMTLGDVLFASGKALLLPGATSTIDRLAEFLRNQSNISLLIEGHTDSKGGEEYNLDLSQRRADAVREALLSRGIPAERVRTRGRGKNYPVASNDSPGGRQQNRRVEIIFSDEKGQFAPAVEQLSGL